MICVSTFRFRSYTITFEKKKKMCLNSDMHVFDELRFLENFFDEERRKGRSIAEYYETVQRAGNVLPRL